MNKSNKNINNQCDKILSAHNDMRAVNLEVFYPLGLEALLQLIYSTLKHKNILQNDNNKHNMENN